MKWTRWVEIARYLNPRFWIRLADEFQWRTDDVEALRKRLIGLECWFNLLRDDMIVAREIVQEHGTHGERLSRHEGFLHEEAIIFGSGPSLLELSEKEREHLRTQGTIGMNRYYVFDDLIGVSPTYVYLGDYGSKLGTQLFKTFCHKAGASARPPVFLLEAYYSLMAPPFMQTLYFHRPDGGTNLAWSRSLDEPLFNHRGSLTSLLNLCGILRLAPHIRLLGVDLDRPGHFFDCRREQFPQLFGKLDDEANRKGGHSTMVYIKRMGAKPQETVLTHWATMMKELAVTGIRVTCPRKDNVLVRNGLCDFDPIPGGESGGSEARNLQPELRR